MAIDFVCGFECRQVITAGGAIAPDENHWDGLGSGSQSISTTTVRSGFASLRNNLTANFGNINKTLARNVVAGRFYIRFATLPDINFIILSLANASGNFAIKVASSGQLQVDIGTTADTNVGSPMTTGQWYRIDFLADASGGTAHLKCRIDGGTETDLTNAQASANFTTMRFGAFTAVTVDCFLDDLILGDAAGDYPFGAGTVERAKPTRDGTHSFTAGDFGFDVAGGNVGVGATDVYTYLDDDDLNSTADLIRQIVARPAGYVEVGFTAPFSHDALAVNVVSSFHSAGTGANTFGLKLNDGGTLRNLTNEAGTGLSDVSLTAISFAEKIMTTAPSGGPFTAAKINAMTVRGGYSDDVVAIPYWDAVMLEIAYIPATSESHSGSGSMSLSASPTAAAKKGALQSGTVSAIALLVANSTTATAMLPPRGPRATLRAVNRAANW